MLDLFIASARALGRTALEHRQLAQMQAAGMAQTQESLTARLCCHSFQQKLYAT